jgi:hypothetical protein
MTVTESPRGLTNMTYRHTSHMLEVQCHILLDLRWTITVPAHTSHLPSNPSTHPPTCPGLILCASTGPGAA